MSIRIMNAIWDSGAYEQTTLIVLLSIADQCSDAGECWPSITTIAKRARCSERHARRVISDLEQDGILRIEHREGRSSVYRIILENIPTPDAQVTPDSTSPLTPTSPPPRTPRSGGGGHPGQGTPDTQVRENHKEPPMNLFGEETPRPVTAQTLMAEWIDMHDTPPLARIKGHMSKEIKNLLNEGIEPDEVRAALAIQVRKGTNPGVLPSHVMEARARRRATVPDDDWRERQWREPNQPPPGMFDLPPEEDL